MSEPSAPDGSTGGVASRRGLLGLRIAAAAILALGLLIAYQTVQIGAEGGYELRGPTIFPIIVSVGLLVFGTLFLLRTTLVLDRDLAEQAASEESETSWGPVLLVLAILLVYAFALDFLGYIVATTLFFPTVTRIIGSRRPLRDFIVGLVLALVLYFGFTMFLGVRLPGGVLEPIL